MNVLHELMKYAKSRGESAEFRRTSPRGIMAMRFSLSGQFLGWGPVTKAFVYVPRTPRRTANITPTLFCDTPEYALGAEEDGSASARTLEKFRRFVQEHQRLGALGFEEPALLANVLLQAQKKQGSVTPIEQARAAYLQSAEKAEDNNPIRSICFEIDGRLMLPSDNAKNTPWWGAQRAYMEELFDMSEEHYECVVTGKRGPARRGAAPTMTGAWLSNAKALSMYEESRTWLGSTNADKNNRMLTAPMSYEGSTLPLCGMTRLHTDGQLLYRFLGSNMALAWWSEEPTITEQLVCDVFFGDSYARDELRNQEPDSSPMYVMLLQDNIRIAVCDFKKTTVDDFRKTVLSLCQGPDFQNKQGDRTFVPFHANWQNIVQSPTGTSDSEAMLLLRALFFGHGLSTSLRSRLENVRGQIVTGDVRHWHHHLRFINNIMGEDMDIENLSLAEQKTSERLETCQDPNYLFGRFAYWCLQTKRAAVCNWQSPEDPNIIQRHRENARKLLVTLNQKHIPHRMALEAHRKFFLPRKVSQIFALFTAEDLPAQKATTLQSGMFVRGYSDERLMFFARQIRLAEERRAKAETKEAGDTDVASEEAVLGSYEGA